MKAGKTSLKTQKEEAHFCRQVAERRRMRKEFDKSLGKVRYVHVEREKVTNGHLPKENDSLFYNGA